MGNCMGPCQQGAISFLQRIQHRTTRITRDYKYRDNGFMIAQTTTPFSPRPQPELLPHLFIQSRQWTSVMQSYHQTYTCNPQKQSVALNQNHAQTFRLEKL